jgi:hypothetical protein
MGLEVTRSVIGSMINNHEKSPEKYKLWDGELERLKSLENEVTRISNFFAKTIFDQIELLKDYDTYDFPVQNIDERDSLNYDGIIFNDKIFKRTEGLKVFIIEINEIYELVGGIDNEHWSKIK